MAEKEEMLNSEQPLDSKEFASGFEGGPPQSVTADDSAKPAETSQPETTETVERESAQAAPPDFRITKEQYDTLHAAAERTGRLEAQMSTAFGTLGNVQQIVKTLQAATPAGMTIEVPKDAFAEMQEDYPDLAEQLRAGLGKLLKNVRGTAPTETLKRDEIASMLVEEATKREMEYLDDAYPDWRETVGPVGADGTPDSNNGFRKWLATQPIAYQERVNLTKSGAVIAKALDRYAVSKAKPETAEPPKPKQEPKPAQPNPRAERIRDAIQPKGDGGHPSNSNNTASEFESGFLSG